MPNLSNLAFQASNKLSSMIGNPGQMMEQQIYHNAVDSRQVSQYRVVITPINISYTVKGLLTNELTIGIDAKWEAAGLLETITSNPLLSTIYPIMTAIAGASGVANPGSVGVSTRKIYTNSGYLEFDIQFRVVDWQGAGDPIKSAFLLSTMCLPTDVKNMSSEQIGPKIAGVKKVLDLSNDVLKLTAGLITDVTSSVTKGAEFLGKLTGADVIKKPAEGVAAISQGAQDFINQYIKDNDLLVTAASPSPVMVQIGNYFRHPDMVVQSVKATFSKQATLAGPLYADFDVNVSSREAILLDDTSDSARPELGLMLKGQNARVLRKGAGSSITPSSGVFQ